MAPETDIVRLCQCELLERGCQGVLAWEGLSEIEEGAEKLVVWIDGLEMLPSGAEAQLIWLALSARLNSLRKKGEISAKSAESIPQGLKAALILLLLCRG